MWGGYILKFLQRLFGFWLSLVLKDIMVPGRSFNLPASKCLYMSESDPGEGPGRSAPPLIFGPNCGPKGRKIMFLDRPIPLTSGSG